MNDNTYFYIDIFLNSLISLKYIDIKNDKSEFKSISFILNNEREYYEVIKKNLEYNCTIKTFFEILLKLSKYVININIKHINSRWYIGINSKEIIFLNNFCSILSCKIKHLNLDLDVDLYYKKKVNDFLPNSINNITVNIMKYISFNNIKFTTKYSNLPNKIIYLEIKKKHIAYKNIAYKNINTSSKLFEKIPFKLKKLVTKFNKQNLNNCKCNLCKICFYYKNINYCSDNYDDFRYNNYDDEFEDYDDDNKYKYNKYFCKDKYNKGIVNLIYEQEEQFITKKYKNVYIKNKRKKIKKEKRIEKYY